MKKKRITGGIIRNAIILVFRIGERGKKNKKAWLEVIRKYMNEITTETPANYTASKILYEEAYGKE